jgi:hypothetical protein
LQFNLFFVELFSTDAEEAALSRLRTRLHSGAKRNIEKARGEIKKDDDNNKNACSILLIIFFFARPPCRA